MIGALVIKLLGYGLSFLWVLRTLCKGSGKTLDKLLTFFSPSNKLELNSQLNREVNKRMTTVKNSPDHIISYYWFQILGRIPYALTNRFTIDLALWYAVCHWGNYISLLSWNSKLHLIEEYLFSIKKTQLIFLFCLLVFKVCKQVPRCHDKRAWTKEYNLLCFKANQGISGLLLSLSLFLCSFSVPYNW